MESNARFRVILLASTLLGGLAVSGCGDTSTTSTTVEKTTVVVPATSPAPAPSPSAK